MASLRPKRNAGVRDTPSAKKFKGGGDESQADGHSSPSTLVAVSTSGIIATQLLEIEEAMCEKLGELSFVPPITHIYNPLDYASQTHAHYVGRYGNSLKRILFVGMNPGPFGMAQNGVSRELAW